MHSFLFHIGDYATHTSHLSPMEDLAYRRLIDLYYLQESPPIGTPIAISRRIRLPQEISAVEQVLHEFFEEELTDSGDNPAQLWRNKRCDEEIEKYQSLKEYGRKGAAKRWDKGGDRGVIAPPLPTQCDPNANHKPLTINHNHIEKNTPRKRVDRPDDVTESVWEAFLQLRKGKRAAVSDIALRSIRKEANKAGLSLDAAMQEMCARGWMGFKADWYQKQVSKSDVVAVMTGRKESLDPRIQEHIDAILPPISIR